MSRRLVADSKQLPSPTTEQHVQDHRGQTLRLVLYRRKVLTHPPFTSNHGRIATWKREPRKTTKGRTARKFGRPSTKMTVSEHLNGKIKMPIHPPYSRGAFLFDCVKVIISMHPLSSLSFYPFWLLMNRTRGRCLCAAVSTNYSRKMGNVGRGPRHVQIG